MDTIHLTSVDSTQLYAKKNAHSFTQNKITCIAADNQTAGRGRFQRTWHSPPNCNIYATFYFQLPQTTPDLINLTQLMAASFSKCLINEGLPPKIKWPNDIQLNNKKLCGILCETVFHKHGIELFCGIGINVNMEPKDFIGIDQPAT